MLTVIHNEATANIVSFIVIALLVMAVCNVVGNMLSKTMEWMGLGCVDMMLGAVAGFVQGVLLITIFLIGIMAFFPKTDWMAGSRLPPLFFGACHLSSHFAPSDLAEKIAEGVRTLEIETKSFLQQKNGVS